MVETSLTGSGCQGSPHPFPARLVTLRSATHDCIPSHVFTGEPHISLVRPSPKSDACRHWAVLQAYVWEWFGDFARSPRRQWPQHRGPVAPNDLYIFNMRFRTPLPRRFLPPYPGKHLSLFKTALRHHLSRKLSMAAP